MINLNQLSKSFNHAKKGLLDGIRQEQNLRIEIFIGLSVLVLAVGCGLSVNDLCLIFLVIAFVLLTELINSAIERVIDVLKPRIHSDVKEIKDLMAAASFLSVVTAVIIGLLVFWPHFMEFSNKFFS